MGIELGAGREGVGNYTARKTTQFLDREERLLRILRLLLLLLLLLWSERIEVVLRLLHACLLCSKLSVFGLTEAMRRGISSHQ